MRAARRAADTARDVNCVRRLPVLQDHFVSAGLPRELPAFDVRVERPPVIEIYHGAQRETPTSPRYRVDLESPDPGIAGEFLQHKLVIGRALNSRVGSVIERSLRLFIAQIGATIHIEFYRKILEDH